MTFDKPHASLWKPLVEDFGIKELDEIAAEIKRVPAQCVWYVFQEMGDHAQMGYRLTAVDAIDDADPNGVFASFF